MGARALSFSAVADLGIDSVARGQQVLHIGNLLFLAFNFGCAYAPTAADLLGFRILCTFPPARTDGFARSHIHICATRPAGFAGSAPIACGGGTVSDLFSEKDRASAMALY